MTLAIVSTAERPDLVETTLRWRWDEFMREGDTPYADLLIKAQATAAAPGPIPQTLVLLANGTPVGTASLAAQDLDERPDLTPWLAGVVVAEAARGQGHAAHLVREIERRAGQAGVQTLWLYTRRAERIYARLGWTTTETLHRKNGTYALMCRTLAPGGEQQAATGPYSDIQR